jgi:hypothetical protein
MHSDNAPAGDVAAAVWRHRNAHGVNRNIWRRALSANLAAAGAVVMNDNDTKRDDFLSKALDAEERADMAEDADIRESWLRIAKSYRILAQHRE